MALIRFATEMDPVGSMLGLQRELERFLRNPNFPLGVSAYGEFPLVNVFADREGAVIMMEIPGLDPGTLNVSGQAHTLTISGERKPEEPEDYTGYHRRERPFGEFSRSVQLPDDLDLDRATAKYEAGLLIVRVPKREEAKPRQISVQSA